MAIDNKLSNIIGTKIPQWVINQLSVRSAQNARLDKRDNDNLVYLANKTAWVRLVSSVNISANDLDYFSKLVPNVSKPEDLAKQYVLFGGTSVYINQTGQPSYNIRSGMSGIKPNAAENGAYGMLGTSEIQDYGYRPMPGITNVNIETQGRLGSVRQAIINFKCWDKAQIDIIDAIYFKLGYSMFLEWGHTYYYPSPGNPNAPGNEQVNKLKSTEFSIVDPFAPGLTKESIFRQISVNSRESEGNYDAMLGIVTNFNFSYNQEGGYDCTLRLMSLGVLGDSIKINNPSILPDILRDEVLQLSDTLRLSSTVDSDLDILARRAKELADQAQNTPDVYTYINTKGIADGQLVRPLYNRIPVPKGYIKPANDTEYEDIIRAFSLLGSKFDKSVPVINQKPIYDFVFDVSDYGGKTLFLQKFGTRLPEDLFLEQFINGITVDKDYFYQIIDKVLSYPDLINLTPRTVSRTEEIVTDSGIQTGTFYSSDKVSLIYSALGEKKTSSLFKTFKIPYRGQNQKIYFVSVEFNFSELNSLIQQQLNGPSEIVSINLYGETYTFPEITKSNVNRIPLLFGSTITLTEDAERKSREARLSYFSTLRNIFPKQIIDTFFNKKDSIAFNFDVSDVDIVFIPISEIEDTIKAAASSKLFTEIYNSDDDSAVARVIRNVNGLVSKYNYSYELRMSGEFDVPITINFTTDGNPSSTTELYPVSFTISFDDTSLIQDVNVENISEANLLSESFRSRQEELISEQNQIQQAVQAQQQQQQKELATQVAEALSYQSALEIILRTIQVKSLNQAFYQTGKVDLEIGRKVYKFEMSAKRNRPFLNQILSNGIYSGFIETLIDSPEKISNANYKTDEDKFLVNAKYGFATTLLGSDSKDPFENLLGKEVNYSEILNAYVVPYQIDQEIVAGVKTNHPVYVPFGLLVFLLNHVCSLYDTALESSVEESTGTGILGAQQRALTAASRLAKVKQKPLVYLDYNPNLNFFLTNPQQLSTNPWVALIPYEGRFDDYRKLFDKDVIDNNSIRPLSGSQQSTPLFNPETQDLLSWQLPKIKDSSDLYRGKLMNVLINIDYLTSLIKDYSFKDGTNNVFLKPFLEHILSDVNKYLGNFNALRLSYNDRANTFQFVDDQYIPSLPNEPQIPYKPSSQDIQNRTEIPLVGRDSIAKSFELKTEISSRLASMIAISANSNPNEQVQNSINGDSFGFLNKNYSDRYIPRRLSAGDEKTAQKEGEKTTSIQFNQTISDFYSKINPAYSDVSQATSFFIDKMSVQKNQTGATRSSVLIPVGANIGLDGIGGLTMGQAFTISDRLLPYNYYSNNPGNIFDGYVNQVGFVIVGLSHVIDNNTWTTNIRTQMMPVKDNSLFGTPPPVLKKNEGTFGINEYNIINATNANRLREILASLQYLEKGNELANAGDITPKLMSEAAALFREIKNTYPNLVIQVTGGNDIFHLNRSDSRHKSGNGLDFIIVNGTDQDVINVGNLVAEFAKKYQISYKDEYDESKQSAGATGNHFHISV